MNQAEMPTEKYEDFLDLSIKEETYEGKEYPLEKNFTHFLEEFTYIFLPLEIKVSFFKPQKCIFSQLISRNGTFEVIFSVNFLRLWQIWG